MFGGAIGYQQHHNYIQQRLHALHIIFLQLLLAIRYIEKAFSLSLNSLYKPQSAILISPYISLYR